MAISRCELHKNLRRDLLAIELSPSLSSLCAAKLTIPRSCPTPPARCPPADDRQRLDNFHTVPTAVALDVLDGRQLKLDGRGLCRDFWHDRLQVRDGLPLVSSDSQVVLPAAICRLTIL